MTPNNMNETDKLCGHNQNLYFITFWPFQITYEQNLQITWMKCAVDILYELMHNLLHEKDAYFTLW